MAENGERRGRAAEMERLEMHFGTGHAILARFMREEGIFCCISMQRYHIYNFNDIYSNLYSCVTVRDIMERVITLRHR